MEWDAMNGASWPVTSCIDWKRNSNVKSIMFKWNGMRWMVHLQGLKTDTSRESNRNQVESETLTRDFSLAD